MRGKAHLAITTATLYPVCRFIGYISIPLIIGAYIGTYALDFDRMFGMEHRHISHSLIFVFSVSFLIFLFNHMFGIGFLIAALMHLWADSITPMGLPYLLYPFKK